MDGLAIVAEVPRYERHPQLYHDDGDVVLRAHISSEGHPLRYQLFCVRKAILSAHSDVFSNLFSDASENVGPTYDGKPLINMADEAADVSHLLLYLYDSSRYLLRNSHPDTPLELLGAARLADKYVMPTVRAAMVRRVTMDWPTTVSQWDIHQARIRAMEELITRPDYPQYIVMARLTPEPVAAINFAHAHGCPELLPAAFYHLASIDVGNDWTVLDQFPHPSARLFARWPLCANEDLLRCMRGKQALAEYHTAVYTRLKNAEPLAEDCKSLYWVPGGAVGQQWDWNGRPSPRSPCAHCMHTLCEMGWGQVPMDDPLRALADLIDYRNIEDLTRACPAGLCVDCEAELALWVTKERMALWGRLSDYFKLK
ncbi:uncharacterized protein TRAVEDRAFT_22549 [Trametes versicolor FP-101664 SS1]|uniref:uncharacterized protein n=1 Tax=Trametes versicolor (strain FP-101664) TaxID=717944 RepID=UPI0004624370|nr:uncharacterized protein TRAVEDRAFT_22549 [Trametes versicolor FP-101664 SS1]EIW56245.1 hypothetical protein TRAVEDRAFT_22549 [Trametes versicolor FP-101664 SS1]